MAALSRLFGKRWKFRRASFTESTEELKNPARGWYQIHTYLAEEPFSPDEEVWCLSGEDTLALLLIDLGAFRERDLNEDTLRNIEEILSFFAEKGKDLILRLAYDHEGKAKEREPVFFSRLAAHVAQLEPLLKRYAPHIFVFQGLLMGNWGEMHSSRFLTREKMGRMASLLGDCLGEETYLAVRRPVYWRMLHPEYCGRESFAGVGMGLFDDAILGSDTHLGTFGAKAMEQPDWDEPWPPEQELTFEEQLGLFAPQGGETICDPKTAGMRPAGETVERLRRMRLAYLNRVHDARQLAIWKEQLWEENDPYRGLSLYDYIGRHLGYRFCVRGVSVSLPRGEESCQIQVSVENVGFAGCYQKTALWLEWEDQGQPCRRRLEPGLEQIRPGETVQAQGCFVPAEGPLYLRAGRLWDQTPVSFANEQADRQGILLGFFLPL